MERSGTISHVSIGLLRTLTGPCSGRCPRLALEGAFWVSRTMSGRPKSDVGPSRSPHRPGTRAGRQARLLTRPSPHPLPTSNRHPRPATSPSTPTPAHPGRAHHGAHVEFAMGSGSSCHPQAVRRRDVTRFGWVADPRKGRRAFSPSAAEDGSVSPAPGRRESPPGEPSGDPRARPLSSLQQARRFPLRRGDSRTG